MSKIMPNNVDIITAIVDIDKELVKKCFKAVLTFEIGSFPILELYFYPDIYDELGLKNKQGIISDGIVHFITESSYGTPLPPKGKKIKKMDALFPRIKKHTKNEDIENVW